jgi:hypothetical protein
MHHISKFAASLSGLVLAMIATAAFIGCDHKEKLIDIETPGADVEVERSTDTGEVDVDVDVDDR